MQVKKETKLAEALDRVFLAALLITGNTDAAETAVLHGIATLDGTLSSEGLLLATLKSAIDEGRNLPGRIEAIPVGLPLELRRVLLLNTKIRPCFVLRALLGMSSKMCSDLLQVPIWEVAQLLSDGMQQLAIFISTTMPMNTPALAGRASGRHDLA